MTTIVIKHDYSSERLPKLIEEAIYQYEILCSTLLSIQELTHIPGIHTDINSDDNTEGVLERIQAMYEEGDGKNLLEVFKWFDEDAG